MHTTRTNKSGLVILVILTALLIGLLAILSSRIQPIPDVSVNEGDQCTQGGQIPSGCVTCCSCGKCAGVTKTCNEVCGVGQEPPANCPSSCSPGANRCVGQARCTCMPDNDAIGCYEEVCVPFHSACGGNNNPSTPSSTTSSQGSYGACGGCSSCDTDQKHQCRTDPSGACVWDATGCGGGGGSTSSASGGGGGGSTSRTTTSTSVSTTSVATSSASGGGVLPDTALISDSLGMIVLGGILLVLGFSLVNQRSIGSEPDYLADIPEPVIKTRAKPRPKNIREFEKRFDDQDN